MHQNQNAILIKLNPEYDFNMYLKRLPSISSLDLQSSHGYSIKTGRKEISERAQLLLPNWPNKYLLLSQKKWIKLGKVPAFP